MSWPATRPFEPTVLGPTELLCRDIGLQLTELLARQLAASIAFIENISSGSSRRAIVFAMGEVGLAPVAEARERQEDELQPQDPAPAEIPIVRVGMHEVRSLGSNAGDRRLIAAVATSSEIPMDYRRLRGARYLGKLKPGQVDRRRQSAHAIRPDWISMRWISTRS